MNHIKGPTAFLYCTSYVNKSSQGNTSMCRLSKLSAELAKRTVFALKSQTCAKADLEENVAVSHLKKADGKENCGPGECKMA